MEAHTQAPDAPPVDAPQGSPSRASVLLRWLSPLAGLALFAAAVWVLHKALQDVSYREVRQTMHALPGSALWMAMGFTTINYCILCCFDLLAFLYVGRRPNWKVAVTSFVGYAVANNVGFAIISGTSVRYRFYSRWGLTADEISRIVVFYSGTFWLGFLVLSGYSMALDPPPGMSALLPSALVSLIGWSLIGIGVLYISVAVLRRKPVRVWRWTIPVPPPRIVVLQFMLSTVDWTLAGAGFYVLLPRTELTFGVLLGAFMAAQLVGLISHVPGGVGVFEGTMIILLGPYLTPSQIISSLVVYRLIYYIAPLSVALVILVADEVRLRRQQFARFGTWFGNVSQQLAPRVLAMFMFLGGALLLVSGATPTEAHRLRWIDHHLPLVLVEAGYLIGSVAGVGLLIVSNGVARRLDMAYYLGVVMLAAGIGASLLKGADYEEAAMLAGVLVALAASRPAFDRRTGFFAAKFSPGWVFGLVAVVGAAVWLGFFAFKHVEYSDELWWRFALNQDAPRALRATMLAIVLMLAFGVLRLLKPAPAGILLPSDEDLQNASRLIQSQSSTVPYLVYLRDKTVMFSDDGQAFLMYAVQGGTWVAMGDPVGDPRSFPDLIRRFFERCDDYGGVPVFYQVGKERLHQYADFGLTFAKLGEEAFVDLPSFHMDGAERKPFRLVLNRFAKAGLTFRIAPAEEVPALLPRLREVSDEWLRGKRSAEKGFSLGFFSPEYARRFPVALVEQDGRLVAFATVWPGPDRAELSVDLMRYRTDAPRNVMEALLLHLMLWGRDEGYRRFNLGMAPLSGLEVSAVAPAWTRIGNFLFQRGEALYNFQGLRTYKEKFHPAWEPRYLAYPGGLALPRVTADVSALIAGGYRGIFRRGRPG
ncbi:bifunctional lysylphosphatidylglycerol flippase/synthetase MprF [Longimicrobium terrae]|uniref:Phosphatidylglycerol lysyltransferase n=1 Tax=Longimicrobium terrae TaxID=1639882 RepID=A0A841GYC4_9BACT|nr:phosphatidylglycerol lysyltransferase [Longimicrobium terrae]MBB6070744.1 phosphatidylglycerol lysyltransferase [Longimicrobium terrae]NNC29723.1 bifunctional lysylphosphatidylglycerol flippase/synthetase MprF [Longimicrobium terrae]